ncbi:hypothetical protein D3Z47_04645 [Lachnospiraceae bacterium]|nr:hypothetical protein [Lachnospiraceae bacterium]
MKELQIERNMDNKKITVTLTDDELEKAYRIMERRYLDEDFANALADAAQDPDTRFHSGHLEEFPELSDWLCAYFDGIYDANMSHNDLLELALNRLHDASLEPQFFLSLSLTAPAVCMGIEKDITDCEQNCGRYHRCSNIAEADDRSRQWETLASLLTMHQNGSCTCSRDGSDVKCPAAKYLTGTWDISEFFHSEDRKEAAT